MFERLIRVLVGGCQEKGEGRARGDVRKKERVGLGGMSGKRRG